MPRRIFAALLIAFAPATAHELSTSGARFLLDGRPFPYTGISFFNAIYNPAFNRSSEDRTAWLRKFQKYGINVLRIWAQWDSRRGFVDACAECTLYSPEGNLRTASVERLKAIAADADRQGMVLELTLFSQESWHDGIRLGHDEADRAVAALAREMQPFRNVAFQIWNEFSERVADHARTIKSVDARRPVTNSPGGAGVVLADAPQMAALDFYTPHTSRQRSGKTWEIAPQEIRLLLVRYGKPVVDDEPARNGTPQFGGPAETTYPYDHILQISRVWQAGGYINYHHDMFQTGAGSPAVPPSGVPDPEFSPYHRAVLEFIALRSRYAPPQ